MYSANFINIVLNENTYFVYSVRKLIQKAISSNLNMLKGKLLDLGCGEMPYKEYIMDGNKKIVEYIGVDIRNSAHHQEVKPDVYWDAKKIPLHGNSVDSIIATEFFEHIPNISEILLECFRVLRKNGVILFTVPFVWPLHETPYDQYRYTPYSLKRLFKEAGFRSITVKTLGSYHASLAQMICIWLNGVMTNMSNVTRKKFFIFAQKLFFYPIIKHLLNKDLALDNSSYGENTMAPGFYGYARK
jgi:SAM-dependent methyltransferase